LTVVPLVASSWQLFWRSSHINTNVASAAPSSLSDIRDGAKLAPSRKICRSTWKLLQTPSKHLISLMTLLAWSLDLFYIFEPPKKLPRPCFKCGVKVWSTITSYRWQIRDRLWLFLAGNRVNALLSHCFIRAASSAGKKNTEQWASNEADPFFHVH
jgi:hypothetical protein